MPVAHILHALQPALAETPRAVLGLQPVQMIGIPLALTAAVLMSLGARYQHRGVSRVHGEAAAADVESADTHTLSFGQARGLLTRPSWLVGTLCIGLAIALQLASLLFAPLIVVQPLGVVSLVLTTIITARDTGRPLSLLRGIAVSLCVAGVAVFVTLAALNSREFDGAVDRIILVLVLLGAVMVLSLVAVTMFRRSLGPMAFVVAAGVLNGMLVTLAKITLTQLRTDFAGGFDLGRIAPLTWVTIGMLAAAAILGAYFVQLAYASGSPDMAVAGLTVVDPLVAVAVGIAVLGETNGAPLATYLGFIGAGLVAVLGVLLLVRGRTPEDVARDRQAVLDRANRARTESIPETPNQPTKDPLRDSV